MVVKLPSTLVFFLLTITIRFYERNSFIYIKRRNDLIIMALMARATDVLH
jgi:hypothetical protein